MSDDPDDVPEKDRFDIARNLALGFVGAIPGGSIIVSIADAIIPSSLETRRVQFLETIGRGLKGLEKRLSSLEEITESEDFRSLCVRVAESIRRDNRKEKLDALASALGNSETRKLGKS